MSPKSWPKFAAVLTLTLTIILGLFSLPLSVKAQELAHTPSQTLEASTQAVSTMTPTSTNTLTPTSTPSISPNTPTTRSSRTATTGKHPTATGTPTPTPALSATEGTVPTEDLPPGAYVDDEVLLKLKTRNPSQAFLVNLKNLNAEIKTKLSDLGVLLIQVPAGSVPAFIANIKLLQDVAYAEPNYRMSLADTIPNDGGWGLQYGPAAIRAPQGWDLSTGSSAVTIAVIDTGIDQAHPDLAAKIAPGYDFVNNDNNPQDDNGHGTHVAGIAAAASDNGFGIAGISWGARLMPVKVLDASGNGSYANAAAGIVWAADNGAQVINLSFGGAAPSTTLDNAVIYASNKGVTIVAAAGNSGANALLYPARYPEVIAVAATDGSNTRAGFSNYGPEMSVSAPGVSIYSSLPGGSYGYKSGTSMSAPMVSGAAAILAGLPGNDNPAAIRWELQSSALDLGAPGFDSFYGYGLIQLDAAIRLALPLTPTPTSMPTSTSTQISISTQIFTSTPTTSTSIPTSTPTPTFTAISMSTLTLTPTATLTPLRGISPTPTFSVTVTFSSTFTPFPTTTRTRLPTAVPAASHTPRPWIVFPPFSLFPTSTPTATLTLTITAAAIPALAGITLTASPTPTIATKDEIQAQETGLDDSLLLPCLGILFILAGLGLALFAIRWRN